MTSSRTSCLFPRLLLVFFFDQSTTDTRARTRAVRHCAPAAINCQFRYVCKKKKKSLWFYKVEIERFPVGRSRADSGRVWRNNVTQPAITGATTISEILSNFCQPLLLRCLCWHGLLFHVIYRYVVYRPSLVVVDVVGGRGGAAGGWTVMAGPANSMM